MKDELERIKRFLGKSEALRAWDSRLRRGWASDDEYQDAVDRLCRVRMKSLGLDPDGELPVTHIPEDFGDRKSGIHVGYPAHEEIQMPGLHLPVEEFTECHVGFWGKTRWGKTFLMAHLVKEVREKEPERGFLAYDTQRELAGILANLLPEEKLLYIPFEDYWKNPLQEVYGHGLDEALGNIKRALMESQFIGAQSVNLLEKMIRRRCTSEKLGALGPPNFKEILHIIRGLEESRGKGRGAWGKGIEYLHSLMNILENLSVNLNKSLNREISRGFKFSDFKGKVVVIDISSIRDSISLKFFIAKELLDISLYAESPHPPMTVLLDETHRFAPLVKQWGTYSNEALVDDVKTSLKKGLNFWMAEQNPGQFVNPAILANVGTHFTFRVTSVKDRWPVLYSINVDDREQAEIVGCLKKMHCLVYTDSLGAAVLIKTPELDIRDLNKEVARRCAPIIRDFHERFLKESPEKKRDVNEKNGNEGKHIRPVQEITKKRIAGHRAKYPLSGITESYQEAGISPEIGRKHLKEMLELGWLEGPERMPLPGKGHKTKDCYAVTEKGCETLGLEWEKARLPGKGSLKSRLAAMMIGLFLKKQRKVVRYEYTLGSGDVSKAADVAVLENEGGMTAYEYQNANTHLIENIRKNAEAGFRWTVVVSPNERGRKLARKTAKQELELGLLNKAEFATLKEFV